MYKRNKNIFQVNKIRISIINTLNIMQYVINIEMKYRRKRAESESPSLSLKYGCLLMCLQSSVITNTTCGKKTPASLE